MLIGDTLNRPIRSLRISVTDRCNLRCQYCMPEEEYVWLPKTHLLSFAEISSLVDVFADTGVDKVRLTGGEPLLRRGLPELVRRLLGKPAMRDVALTTNGILLAGMAQPLVDAGLHRVTVSLDTLRPDRFERLTRRDGLREVLAGVDAAAAAGLGGLKIDTVVMRGVNDDELMDLLAYGKRVGAEVRFVEYMDVGGATRWSMKRVVTRADILQSLEQRLGLIEPVVETSTAPADRFMLSDGTVFGIVASVTAPFCRSCDRGRLTADGMWYLCLYAKAGIDLRRALRGGASPEELRALITTGWQQRADRGAEDRLAAAHRAPLVRREVLQRDSHLEMHTRGG